MHIFLHCIFGNEAPYMYLASFLAHAADPSQGLSFVGHSRAQRLCIHRMNEDHMVGGSEICPGSRMLQRQKQYKGLLAQTKHHGHSMHKNSILRQVYIYIYIVCVRVCICTSPICLRAQNLYFFHEFWCLMVISAFREVEMCCFQSAHDHHDHHNSTFHQRRPFGWSKNPPSSG